MIINSTSRLEQQDLAKKNGRLLRRVLKKGEVYLKDRDMYCYNYTNVLGERKYVYAPDLPILREKEKKLQKDQLDGVDIYLAANNKKSLVITR